MILACAFPHATKSSSLPFSLHLYALPLPIKLANLIPLFNFKVVGEEKKKNQLIS